MAQQEATDRLLKKLSALRATLPDDEQELLDAFMLRDVDHEVEAHRRFWWKDMGDVTDDEVEAHRIWWKDKGDLTDEEVQAHAVPPGSKLRQRIVFDPDEEVYLIE